MFLSNFIASKVFCVRRVAMAALSLAAFAPASFGASVLIEAETPDRRESANEDFAAPIVDLAGSGGRTLYRFWPKNSRAYWNFTLPSAGKWRGWMRYGTAEDSTTKIAVDPATEPPAAWTPLELPPTGGFQGPGCWKWVRLFEADLEAGGHTLVMTNSPIRLDCFYFTTEAAAPTDAALAAAEAFQAGPAVQAKMATPLESWNPVWLGPAADDYRLPEWFDAARVQAHTRMQPFYLGTRYDEARFLSFAEKIAANGFPVFTRHVLTGDEGTWWPSKTGAVEPKAKDRNWAKEMIDNAHAQGVKFIAYYWHISDKAAIEAHPDWLCRDWEGRPVSSSRGDYVCQNSPFRQYVLSHMLELIEMGADGLYYDGSHMPPNGCWCEHCRAEFKKETGLDAPASANLANPVYLRYLDFNNVSMERTILEWRKAIHEKNPEAVMIVSIDSWHTMQSLYLTSRFLRLCDSPKTEYAWSAWPNYNAVPHNDPTMKPVAHDIRMSQGWDLARDAAGGRPPHLWIPGIPSEAMAMSAMSGPVAHGAVANLDENENRTPDPVFERAVAEGLRGGRPLAGTRPMRWVAIHYSEAARNAALPDYDAMWKDVLFPTLGAYGALIRDRRPVCFVTDSLLAAGDLEGYEILFLPAPGELTPAMRAAAAAFRARGGVVIEQRKDWVWHGPDGGQEAAMAGFREAVAKTEAPAPVEAAGGPEKMHAVAHETPDGKRWVVALTNEFDWVLTSTERRGMTYAEVGAIPGPPPCKGVTLTLRAPEAPSRVVEAVSGATLTAQAAGEGAWRVAVPEFEALASVVVEFGAGE